MKRHLFREIAPLTNDICGWQCKVRTRAGDKGSINQPVLNNKTLFSPSPGGWKWTMVSAGLVPPEAPSLWPVDGIFSLCSQIIFPD
jgi:hypothetical protein